jgi:hypothetical protein
MCRCESIDLLRGARSPGAVSARPPAPPAVRLKFAGANARLLRGPGSGAGYAVFPGDLVLVDPADVQGLVAGENFSPIAD